MCLGSLETHHGFFFHKGNENIYIINRSGNFDSSLLVSHRDSEEKK